jgi:hypothetical protein
MGKRKAPDKESVDKLETCLADIKKAAASQSEKGPQGRPKGSKNKPKVLMTGAEGNND